MSDSLLDNAIKVEDEYFFLCIKVRANASRNEVLEFSNDGIILSIAASADKEKANKEIIKYLAEILEVQKSKLEIVSGHHSNRKRIKADLKMGENEIYEKFVCYIRDKQ
jgi:uncharacterized protein (TIGR00251 family)